MNESDGKYLDGVIRRWLETLAPRGFREAKRLNMLNTMSLTDDTPVLKNRHGMCAICLGNRYTLRQDGSHKLCACQ